MACPSVMDLVQLANFVGSKAALMCTVESDNC